MPSMEKHIEKAEYNKEFLKEIFLNKTCAEKYSDWGIVVVFYIAHHYVHAFFARTLGFSEAHPDDHVTCNMMVAQRLPYCSSDYMQLYNDSRIARYLKPIQPYVLTKKRLEEDIKLISDIFEKL